jgi:hypothetical protein
MAALKILGGSSGQIRGLMAALVIAREGRTACSDAQAAQHLNARWTTHAEATTN